MGRSDTDNAELHNAELVAAPESSRRTDSPTPDVDADLCSVLVATRDALEAGQTMRSLARTPSTPHGTREVLNRVGTQLASAALAKLKLVGGGAR